MNVETDNWKYCRETLPKVSRTFALNISVLKGDLYKSILIAYLFCRIDDHVGQVRLNHCNDGFIRHCAPSLFARFLPY